MKKRFCDQCSAEILTGVDYYKVCLQKHIDKRQTLTHVGDLCDKCWKKNTGVKK